MKSASMSSCKQAIAWSTAAVAALTICSMAVAAEPEQPRAPATAVAGNAPAASTPADAPNARMAALIRPPGVLVLNKGVQRVTNPAAGIYCILPTAATGITPTTAVPTVSVEYYYSKLNEVKVQWAHAGSPCGKARFAVYTFADPSRTGAYKFSNAVAFSIYVP